MFIYSKNNRKYKICDNSSVGNSRQGEAQSSFGFLVLGNTKKQLSGVKRKDVRHMVSVCMFLKVGIGHMSAVSLNDEKLPTK